MRNFTKKTNNLIFDNKYFIFLAFLILIKPHFLTVNSKINLVCNGLLLLIILLVYINYFVKLKISKLQIALILFYFISFISTLMISKDYSFLIKNFLQISAISFYSELLIKNNLDLFLKILSKLLFLLILLNFVTVLIFPDGIFKHDVLLLGYDNATIAILLLGTMFICFASYFFHKKLSKLAILSIFMTIFTYIFRWSVGAIIGCFILLVYFILFYKKPKMSKIFNMRNFLLLSIILFILIVVFDFQKYFSFIIVNIFHKNVMLSGRVTIWKRCFKQISAHPFLGIGVMNYTSRFQLNRIYHAHSNFLNVILETGIIGFISYLYIWLLITKPLMKTRKHELTNMIAFGLFCYLIVTVIDVIDNSQLLYVFWNMSYFIPFIIRKFEENHSSTDKKKILLVIDSGQPLPAVMGGAVETLTDYYLLDNEKCHKYDFDVVSTYHKDLKRISKKWKYASFYYIHKEALGFKIKRILKFVMQKVTRKKLNSVFAYQMLSDLESENKQDYYDMILIENSPSLIHVLRKEYHSNYVLHLHNDINIINNQGNALSKYDKIITCSNYIKKRVESICKNNFVLNVYNGLDEKEFCQYQNSRMKMRKKFGMNDEDIVFGFVGRICPEKGVKELILAFQTATKGRDNCKLCIAGSSFFKNAPTTKYEQEVRDLAMKLKNRIIFTGYINHDKIGLFYSSIDVFVLPSIVNEACPMTVLEATVAGKPLIVSDSGGIPELVTSENALIVKRKKLVEELTHAILLLVDHPIKRKKMGSISLDTSRKYYLDQYLFSFYEALEK